MASTEPAWSVGRGVAWIALAAALAAAVIALGPVRAPVRPPPPPAAPARPPPAPPAPPPPVPGAAWTARPVAVHAERVRVVPQPGEAPRRRGR